MRRTAHAAMLFGILAATSVTSGCSSGGAQPGPGSKPPNGQEDGGANNDDGGGEDGGVSDLAMRIDGAGGFDLRGPEDLSRGSDLSPFTGVISVKIFASNTCKISTEPASIALPAGSKFTVDWINLPTSSYEVDVAKRDPFNLVSILIGLEIGNHYHDTIREWCGIFTGKFSFRISTACDQYEIPVDCNH